MQKVGPINHFSVVDGVARGLINYLRISKMSLLVTLHEGSLRSKIDLKEPGACHYFLILCVNSA